MTVDKTFFTPLCKRLGAILSRRGMLFIGLGIVIIMSAAALLAPWLAPYDPTALHLKSILMPPSAQFPFGDGCLGPGCTLAPALRRACLALGRLCFRQHLHSHRYYLGAARRLF